MTDLKQKLLQKELDYYTNLLKKHESTSYGHNKVQSSAKQLQNCHWKQPALPAYKMVKNSSFHINSTKLHRQISSTNALSQNKRTVLYNETNYTKAKAGESSQSVECVKLPANKVFNKRTVINNVQNRSVVAKNKSANSIITSNLSEKLVSSESEGLLKELVYLTKLLKNSNEKPAAITKSNSVKSAAALNHKYNDSGLEKCDILSTQCERKDKITLHTQTVNMSHGNVKQNTKPNIYVNKAIINLSTPQITNFSKYPKFDAKQNKISPTKNSFIGESKFEKQSNSNKYISDSRLLTTTVLPSNSKISEQNNLNPFKVMTHEKQVFDKRMNMVKNSSYKVINKPSSAISKINSPSSLKSKSYLLMKVKTPATPKLVNKHQAVYSKINKKNTSPLIKQHLKNRFVFRKNSPANQKTKKVNLKYKVVNKSSTHSTSKVFNRQNSKSKESSLFDKSDPLIELLDNSDIDKLEQRLLAVSTSLVAVPEPVAKCPLNSSTLTSSNGKNKSCLKRTPKCKVLTSKYKVVNKNATGKINSKLMIKKTPAKKFLSSKYKVVNKDLSTSKSISFKGNDNNALKNSVKRVCKKVVVTKFSIINKHSPVNVTSATAKANSILVKRLYKSKSTIINKNDNPTYHRAKLIKSKYLGLNKRRSPNFQKHSLHPRMYIKQQRFKNPYIASRLHSKLNRYQQCMVYAKGTRRFSKNINCITSGQYHKNSSIIFKQKRNNVIAHSPVLVIRGTRYSLSSTGKTLKRLPTKGQTKINKTPKRIIIGGKPYVRTSANVMKVVNSPNSVHIASRVLHRSINRVLTASSKKSLTKVNTYCMFYNRFGRCNRGLKCTYIHDPRKIAVCTRFLRGTCKTEGCPFSHEVAPGKMAICSFFLVGACEKDNCPYRHELLSPNAVLCKAFVQGYCPNGKECKKAHILICPKFILGECEKESSCAYPHPPPKVKKNVLKDTVVDKVVTPSEEKGDDALLEKVARYFQPLSGNSTTCQTASETNNDTYLCMPKQRKLGEQPAFIPLSDIPIATRLMHTNQNL